MEMVVVVAVIAVCFGAIAFSINWGGADVELQRQSEELARWIESIGLRASADGSDWVMTIDLDRGLCKARPRQSPTGEARVRYRCADPVRMARVAYVRDDVEVKKRGAVRVRFYANGVCVPHTITLMEDGKKPRTLRANPITGEVTIVRGRADSARVSAEGFLEVVDETSFHPD